ncbi:hypothetical protein B0T20DRAFT_364616 [Sordaria brevicollis]|uniref:Uncharacterized protein n=1 Tax=Sordaria brevicollis TaxID=83679 RepID=A0AAE0U2M8_SORBR|nr:hypothetical protein B0T20DRAFT_364616 [Sordaria brevicollis]
MDTSTKSDSNEEGFGSFNLSPRKDWSSFVDTCYPYPAQHHPLQVRQFFESAVRRRPSTTSTTPASTKPNISNTHVIMDLPRELLYHAFEDIIAPFKEHRHDGLVPQSFIGNGIRFQVVETSFSPKAPHDSDLIVTGEASSRNINQVTGFGQPVDPLQVYHDIQSGTGGAVPDGWLKSKKASKELDKLLLSWKEDEISEEDLTEEDSDNESEPGDENTGNVSENAAALRYTFRASTRQASWMRQARQLKIDPDGSGQAFLKDRRDGDGPIESHRVIIDPLEINHGHATIHPRGTNTEQTMPIAKPNILATEEDDTIWELLHLDPAIFEDDFYPLEYLEYGFVWVEKPQMWETDEEIVAVGSSPYCPRRNESVSAIKSLREVARCRFRSPLQYQNLLRLSQLSRGVTSELGRILYQNCTAEFPYGPHLFHTFAAERPAILPKIRGVILHLECCANLNDTVTSELAYMLSFFSPSLRRPDSPCKQKLEFLSVKLTTTLIYIPHLLEENSTRKRRLMDKLREWAPLFKAVDTNQLVVMLEGTLSKYPDDEGRELEEYLSDHESSDGVTGSELIAEDILAMWTSPTTKHAKAYPDSYDPYNPTSPLF